MGFSSGWSGAPDLKNRFLLFSLAAAAIFLLLIFRLWYLQVVSGERYQLESEKNRTRVLPIAAPRGPVYDRDGHLLVDNRPAFGVSIMRQDVEDREGLLQSLTKYLDADIALLEEYWQKGRRFPAYRPVPMAHDVSRQVMERIQENSIELPGVFIEVRPVRSYPYEDAGAHLFGYLGEITEQELQKSKPGEYRGGDFIGKAGIERLLEPHLRGEEGQRLLEVDVQGKELRQLKVQEPEPGNKVFLTLQRDVQVAAEEAFGDQAGAAVALDVHTGEVLALVNSPSFSPALFARGITDEEWTDLLKSPRHPLQFKAISGQYPPGSTFKIVTALAALQSGAATQEREVTCTGRTRVGNREFRCWKRRGHGRTDLKKALRESCDIWFYEVSLDLGIDRLSKMAFDLGLGRRTDFPLNGEKSGLIPTRQWKRKRFNDSWYDGETVIAAIGQGYVLTTPMQLAVMTAAFANGGTVFQPQVVSRVVDWSGEVLQSFEPRILNKTDLDPEALAAVRDGLEAVVNEPYGTGQRSRLSDVRVAGKTGTAQVVRRLSDEEEKKQKDRKIPYRFRDHALFVAYAPAQAPEIAVAVVVEHGEHGSSAAAPIAAAVLKSYFAKDQESKTSGPENSGSN
ncbi:MAG: penicillin-binding protein 2 [Desulfuromonadales bacterium]|nr:penicillin-binding protein 2 [Desulfuromonadales bacterium]NIR33155.1 penicillin-binding protein 2 [Desulfuromonadales bacterium]NIS41939.1 penicillin-binding protein 2 [Desulfuromonadales bacterium]